MFLNVYDIPKEFRSTLNDFKFNKKKIIISCVLKSIKRKFHYDSGTSSYEFLTYKEEWEKIEI